MIVNIKSDEELYYETDGACAFDFKAKEETIINPWRFWLVDTWTVIEVPKWYVLFVAPRSSTFKKTGLILVNSVWIIDNDYCWNDDTIKLQYLNMKDQPFTINKWDRIWQWIFLKMDKADFNYVTKMETKNRWWFWTTWL